MTTDKLSVIEGNKPTPEDLMKPRYKVIADFPQWSSFKYKKGDTLEKLGIHFVGSGTSRGINENEIDLYPAIFKKLEWWEERKEEDMPQYVKCGMDYNTLKKGYYKPEYWVIEADGETWFKLENDEIGFAMKYPFHDIYPVTESEFINQNK